MNQQQIVSDIEERAGKAGVSIKKLCEDAGVHPTTFSRWKLSTDNPKPAAAKMDRLEAIHAVLERLEAPAATT